MKWTNKGHQFDELSSLLSDTKSVYIYGAAGKGGELYGLLQACNKWLNWEICFVDANDKKQANGYLGVQVLSPEELFKLPRENNIVIIAASPENTIEIGDNLLKTGYGKATNYFHMEQFINFNLPIHLIYNKNIVFFSSQNIIPSTICNLNCQGCLNFTPYIEKHVTYDIEDIKKDIDTFFGVVDYIYRFQVSGGDPLLFPEINILLEYIGEKYRGKIHMLEIVTNGTILPSDEICKTLKRYNVFVYVDDYRKALGNDDKYKLIVDKLQDYHIDYHHNYIEKWFDLAPLTTNHSMWTDEKLEEYFTKCGNPWSTLYEQKITVCNYSHYAAKAGLIKELSDDSFDLSEMTEDNKRELVEFRLGYNEKGYASFCKQCAGFESINGNMIEVAKQVKRNKNDEV